MDGSTDDPGRSDVVIDLSARRATAKPSAPAEPPPGAAMAATLADLIEIQTVTLGVLVGALVHHNLWTESEAVARLEQLAKRASSEAAAWPFQCLAERIACEAASHDAGADEIDRL